MFKIFFTIFFFIILVLIIKKKNTKENILENFKNNVKKNEIIFLIPIRDREKELNILLKKMKKIFENQNINYKIMIIEQSSNKKFNKGKLLNAGFIEITKKFKHINNIHFTDVDNYPLENNIINYSKNIKSIDHYFGFTHCIGGIYAFNKKVFININGFSNNFWGWGNEDVDILNRINLKNHSINRNIFIERNNNKNKIFDIKEGKFNMINSKKAQNFFKKYNEDINNINKDGLNTILYKKLSEKEIEKNIFRVKVDL